jgi:hypothetical protein
MTPVAKIRNYASKSKHCFRLIKLHVARCRLWSDRSYAAVAFSRVGKTVSHDRILDGVGGGGMGLVYSAKDIKRGRRVAIKFLREESAKDRAFTAI